MALSFIEANLNMMKAFNGELGQEALKNALFELMRHSEEIRTSSGEVVGPFETVKQMADYIKTCAEKGENHLLVREHKDNDPHLVMFDQNGDISNYTDTGITPDWYVNYYAPVVNPGESVPRKPNAWDWIVNFFKSIVGGKDEVVAKYEEYEAKRKTRLEEAGYEKPAEAKKETVEDIELDAANLDGDIYESKEEQKLEGAENLISDDDFTDEISPKDKEMRVVRNMLRPENFGYKPTKNLSDIMYQYMPVIANGDDLPEELDGTKLGAEFEAYRNFAQTVYDLAKGKNVDENEKSMRDALVVLSKKNAPDGKSLLSKLYESYKEEFYKDNKLDIGTIMQEAISGNKTNLTKAVNKEPIMGHKTPINNSFAQPTGNSMGKG